MQISDTIKTWIIDDGIKVLPIIGGANVKRQIEKLKKKATNYCRLTWTRPRIN
ncbi:hypothetical protein MCOL2_15987 [Listeria fleischmannii FSL S10-1203]|uniref:Uncharacterized protein n=1 Tax=Listeria fleischmannii FSL S10-1203 TaxID=1265822 RepID=W7DTN9_9LIST|nr:hypothetical protein MCOL2_15987 [Listeria fleischmannii FSL S10-1203]